MPQPTIILDQITYDELLRVLTPLLVDQNQRQALLWSAFRNSLIYSKINFAGSAQTFTINLISTLLTYITPAAQTPVPVTPLATAAVLTPTITALQAQVVADMQHSAVPNTYPVAANQFVDTLFAHLDDFQLPTLGITRSTATDALGRPGVGDRINGMVQSVWDEWVGLANRNSFDLNSTEPTYADHQLSPFRQLVIRMCQNRQGKLFDSQQHALYNFLTRTEDPTVWYTPAGTAGVIAAINRDSFQWALAGP